MSNFDLSSLDALTRNQEDGVDLKVKHPTTGDPLGLTLRIAGAESEAMKKVQRRQTNEAIRNQRKRLTAEDLDRRQRELMIACVLGWNFGEMTIDGEKWEFSKDAVERLLRRYPWIGTQIDDFASDQANFLPS